MPFSTTRRRPKFERDTDREEPSIIIRRTYGNPPDLKISTDPPSDPIKNGDQKELIEKQLKSRMR